MVTHIRYCQEHCRNAQECLAAIRVYLERGWWLSSIEGSNGGPFELTFGSEAGPLRLVPAQPK